MMKPTLEKVAESDPRRISTRTYCLLVNGWGLGVGLAAVLTFLFFYLLPPQETATTSTAQALGPWDDVWNLGYGVGGALVLYGLLKPSKPVDALGLSILGSALLVRAATMIAEFGWDALQAIPSTMALALAAFARVLVVANVVYPRDDDRRVLVIPERRRR